MPTVSLEKDRMCKTQEIKPIKQTANRVQNYCDLLVNLCKQWTCYNKGEMEEERHRNKKQQLKICCKIFYKLKELFKSKHFTNILNLKSMKTPKLLLIMILVVFVVPAQSQLNLNKLGKQIKEAIETKDSQTDVETKEAKTDQVKTESSITQESAEISKGSKTLYVSESTGSNRNDGSKGAPFKDLQKAVDEAPDGAVILVAEGNYQGKLDAGYISIKKYLSIVGGYTTDFSERNPLQYITMICPGASASGTGANYGLLDIYVRGNRNGVILIDGLVLDKGEMNCYFLPDPENPKSGTPEGCLTGRLDPPGFQSSGAPKMEGKTSVSNQLIHGDVEGQVTIRNCVLLNGAHFGIQMGNIGGHFDIYNNVFLANRMAACEVRSMNRNPGETTIDFHNNTVMFVWRRDPMPGDKDLGYGFRYMTGMNANVYDNIFGCIDFSALDRTYIDSDKSKEAVRETSAWNNIFFNNLEADITLPSGGGRFLRVFAKSFEDVDQLIKYEGNHEVTQDEAEALMQAVDAAYLKGFLSMDGSSAMTHNPNSSENILRSALGMNQRGTSSYSVSMYMNRYPLEKATSMFGAIKNYGAQIPK